MTKHRILIVTTSRADFGIYGPVVSAINSSSSLEAGFFVTGQHLRGDMGNSIEEVRRSGHPIWGEADISSVSDKPFHAAQTMGRCIEAIANYLETDTEIDMVLALGDRYEMLAAVSAVLPFVIPIAHLHGGEETLGAIDNAMRHAITKLAHLHFVSTELAARRVRAMGEDPACVIVSGAPALDAVVSRDVLSLKDLKNRFDLPGEDFVISTFHPETLNMLHASPAEAALEQLDTMLQALDRFGRPVVFTAANIDPGGVATNERLKALAQMEPERFRFVETFGATAYFSVLHHASLMVGNSSSGILEAASFGLPVVDIGRRQEGREVSANVIHAEMSADAILEAMKKADTESFRKICRTADNVYGDGKAAQRIVEGIDLFLSRKSSLMKAFYFPSET